MKTWYQVYREGYWYTSTTDKEEAMQIYQLLKEQGFIVEVRIK